MKKSENQADVVVLGSHPAAHFVAALLREKRLNVWCCAIPGRAMVDRLVLVNPELFDLHAFLSPLRRSVGLTSTYGATFLGEDSATASECRQRGAMALVGSLAELADASRRMAEAHGVRAAEPKTIDIHGADEKGVDLSVDAIRLKPRALVVCEELPSPDRRILGIPDAWETGVMHRYTYAIVDAADDNPAAARPTVAMSLELRGCQRWGWLLRHGKRMQAAVVEPIEPERPPAGAELLGHWLSVLEKHAMLNAKDFARKNLIASVDLPLGGAMAHEGVANRTLLVGPAGGFFSASGEDVYPNCWSAVFAANVLATALKETHLQDAIGAFRHEWRTTLGDYLRGPQQNLRFLLPLVYRNQVMTDRLAESIFLGKAIVR